MNDFSYEMRIQTPLHDFTEVHRIEFLNFIISYGIVFDNLEKFWENLVKEKQESFGNSQQENSLNISQFKLYLIDFYSVLDMRDSLPNNIVFCGVDPNALFIRIYGLILLKKIFLKFEKNPESFQINHKTYRIQTQNKSQDNWLTSWTNYDDYLILKGIFQHGYDKWEKILNDEKLWKETSHVDNWKFLLFKLEHQNWTNFDEFKAKKYIEDFFEKRAQNIINFLIESEHESIDQIKQIFGSFNEIIL